MHVNEKYKLNICIDFRYKKEKNKRQMNFGMPIVMLLVPMTRGEILNFYPKNVPALKNQDVQPIAYFI